METNAIVEFGQAWLSKMVIGVFLWFVFYGLVLAIWAHIAYGTSPVFSDIYTRQILHWGDPSDFYLLGTIGLFLMALITKCGLRDLSQWSPMIVLLAIPSSLGISAGMASAGSLFGLGFGLIIGGGEWTQAGHKFAGLGLTILMSTLAVVLLHFFLLDAKQKRRVELGVYVLLFALAFVALVAYSRVPAMWTLALCASVAASGYMTHRHYG